MTATQERPKPDSCADCDLGAIDDLACSAKGIKKRAEVMDEFLPRLQEFKDQFDTARADYTKARDDSQADIDAARKQLTSIIDQLKCLLDEDQKKCLEQALKKVFDDIRDCAGDPGCCIVECDVDAKVDDSETIGGLAGRIEEYRRQTKKAMDCFTSLIQEQTDLPARATTIRAEVAQIGTDIGATELTPQKAVKLLARARVAQYHLDGVWNGFPSVNSYVDCLCRALVCAHESSEAVAVLEGAKAKKECEEQAKDEACKRKQEQTVDEVMAEYVNCRTSKPAESHEDDRYAAVL
jgi:hypothetical protein